MSIAMLLRLEKYSNLLGKLECLDICFVPKLIPL